MLSRRAVVASLAGLVAGCSTLRGSEGRTLLDAGIVLAPSDYRDVEVELEQERTVEFEFATSEDGNVEIDILFLSRSEFDAFAEGEAFDAWPTSMQAVSGGFAERTVPAGEYVVVFDNSDRGTATPDGRTVRGNARVEVFPPN